MKYIAKYLIGTSFFFVASSVAAFSSVPTTHVRSTGSPVNNRVSTQIDFFGKAFANDDSLGKRENAGLKKVSQLPI